MGRASCSSRASEVTTKRGLALPSVHSALATTRRSWLQLSRVRQAKSLKRRAGLPVFWLCSAAWASSLLISSTKRRFLARPNRKSTPLVSHQVISPSRAKPESARSRMRTLGQRRRIWATIRATSATLPWALQPTGLTRGAGIDVRRAQFARQQMPAAEHIERQIAVVVVIAVEKTAFLMAVQRVVGGVKVEGDLRRRCRMGVEKDIDKHGLDLRRLVTDFVIA